ncbi:hypothetical protein DFR50_12261 [Roseiarcus fermentans]|uniref:Uncharacterized protein n=1 Tax=Roseiarcus fermentans TaxID=1473586 RepID=A0A366F3P4_9HYPH|nr:hypothetical protein [Roseiarcus fermentans]RBP09224.1 hypothetical protein DFR50_12261 [Roseiarcus fermentans]
MKASSAVDGKARVNASRAKAAGFGAAALVLSSALAFAADDIPDIKGPWTGKSFTIVAGAAPHWPNNAGTFANPGLGEKDLVIAITHQEGRRFWGTTSLSDDHDRSEEPFIGELYGPGNRKVMIAHTVGVIEGEIDGDVLSFCFAQADGRGPTKSSVVSCTEVHRSR